MPKIETSIIIPTADNVQFLINCVDSIFKTTDLTNKQLIIVDNGSTDQTKQFLTSIKEQLADKLIVITNETNLGFPVAVNQGMDIGFKTSEYCILLNDDTIVGFKALDNMVNDLKRNNCSVHDNIGIIGAKTNYCAGPQCIQELQGLKPEKIALAVDFVNKSAAKIRKEYNEIFGKEYDSTEVYGYLSVFCIGITSGVYKAIGGIDERFSPGGFCDNDYILRAYEAGFGSTICNTAFIYHYGGQTFAHKYPANSMGVNNWPKFINKYKALDTKQTKKLLLIQRIKIDDKFNYDVFIKTCNRNKEFVDEVYILNDRSLYKNFNYKNIKAVFGDIPVMFYNKPDNEGFNEMLDRQFLMKEAKKSNADWVLMLDHDETLSENATKPKLQKMMSPINPKVKAYKFLVNNYWRGFDLVRVDGSWANGFANRMYKNDKLVPIISRPVNTKQNDTIGLHSNTPSLAIPNDTIFHTNLTLEHYGYVNFAVTQAKKTFYGEIDHIKGELKNLLVGKNGYNHLTDERNLQLTKPVAWNLAINVITKNEEAHIGRQILDFYDFTDEFVIVDTGSADATTSNLYSIDIPYKSMTFKDDFSYPRNMCIKNSTTKYCLQIDPDEIMSNDFISNICIALNNGPDVVVAEANNLQKDGMAPVQMKLPRLWRRCNEIRFRGRVHETIEQSIDQIKNLVISPILLRFSNPGFLRSDESMEEKLTFYGRLLEKEVKDNPKNTAALYALGLHYKNKNNLSKSERLFLQCIDISPGFIEPYKDLALIHIHKAKGVLELANNTETPSEDYRKMLEAMYVDLSKWDKMNVKVGIHTDG